MPRRTSLSDGGRDLSGRNLGIVGLEDGVDDGDADGAVHGDLKRPIGGNAADCNGRMRHQRGQPLEAVDPNRAAGIAL